jgi:hypothetical protein
VDEFEIDFMMLADGAQAVGGKIYILGGGWTHIFVPQFPGKPAMPFWLAIGITVPWHLTNRRFTFSIELNDADGQRIEEVAAGEFEQGRPPGLRPGTPQRVLLAVGASPEFPESGRYEFKASVDGQMLRSTSFEAVTQNASEPTASPGG